MNDEQKVKKQYFLWLCNMVNVVHTRRGEDPRELSAMLHQKEFYSIVPNDDNRVEDGKKLREYFADELDISVGPYLDGPCTMFEMLVALAKRIEFILARPRQEDKTAQWFWIMIENLDLALILEAEPNFEKKIESNDRKLDIFLKREYSDLGKGGLFPLKWANHDQRYEEIWYQMMKYLDQNYPNY